MLDTFSNLIQVQYDECQLLQTCFFKVYVNLMDKNKIKTLYTYTLKSWFSQQRPTGKLQTLYCSTEDRQGNKKYGSSKFPWGEQKCIWLTAYKYLFMWILTRMSMLTLHVHTFIDNLQHKSPKSQVCHLYTIKFYYDSITIIIKFMSWFMAYANVYGQ